MKRSSIIVIPIVLLVLINACNMSSGALPKYSPEQWTAIAQTQQVMAQPRDEQLKYWLSAAPTNYDKFDALEESLVGKYDVMGVTFPNDQYYFQVDMDCQCASGSACCVPERMLLLTLRRMAQSRDQILAVVPGTVKYLDVVCHDHKFAFMAMYAPWDTVKSFLLGQISAADLSSSVVKRKMN
jgi:hypothetical protein